MTTDVRPELRRKLALAGGMMALALPALSACGFNYPTDRPNEIINGGTNLDSGMRVNAARIVTPAEGEGVFIATITVNPTVNAATTGSPLPSFVGLTTDDAEVSLTPSGDVSVEVGDSGLVNLADPEVGGIAVTGDFEPGDIVPVTLEFDEDQEPVTVNAPVVTQCGPYESVVAADAPDSVPIEEDDSSESGDSESDAYSCEFPPAELPEEH